MVQRSVLLALTFALTGLQISQQPGPIDVGQAPFSPKQLQEIRQRLGLTAEQLRKATPEQLMEIHAEMDEGEFLQKRAEYESLRTRAGDGKDPFTGHLEAVTLAQAAWKNAGMTTQVVAGIRIGTPPLPVAAKPNKEGDKYRWKSIGPINVPGRTRAITFLKNEPNLILVGSVSGGLWRSNDRGNTFQSVDDALKDLAVTCIAVDPQNPNIIFAGTGEGNGNADAVAGDGIYATNDGVHWQRLPGTKKGRFEFVNRIAVSPDGKTILVAAQPMTPAGHKGIYRSAIPSDWKSWNWVQVSNEDIVDVLFNPKDPNKAVASTLKSGAAFYSTDSGKTWTQAVHQLAWNGDIELTYAAANPSIVYASVSSATSGNTDSRSDLENALGQGAIWKSTDGGMSYALPLNSNSNGIQGGYLGQLGWYCNTIWAGDPTDPNLVVVGSFELWRSTDGGNHLSQISSIIQDGSIHCDQHIIVSDPLYDGIHNRSVLIGNDGGIAETQDIRSVDFRSNSMVTTEWSKPRSGYGSTQFYGAAYSSTLNKIMGGTQDNGTLVYDLSSSSGIWNFFALGDGGYCAADPQSKFLYGEQEFGKVMRSDDGGRYSMYISGPYVDPATKQWAWRSPPNVIGDAANYNIGFVAPFLLDPNNSKRMLVGGYSVWQTNNPDAPFNPGPTWASIGPSGTQTYITAIAIQPGNSAVVWIGYQDGSIFRSTNSTSSSPTWQKVAQPPGFQTRMCTRIVFDPSSPGSVLVGFGGYVHGNLWRCSVDGKWTSLSDGSQPLPAAPLDALAVHPKHANYLYAGTDVGLYATSDGGKTWWPAGPDTCRTNDLVWAETKLILASHGRGMFIVDLSNP
jgi:hypothetical protein